MSLFALITNPANKNGYGTYLLFGARGCPLFDARGHSLGNAYWAYKAVTFLWVNIKPTRPTTSTFRAYQEVYRVSQDYQEAATHLTA